MVDKVINYFLFMIGDVIEASSSWSLLPLRGRGSHSDYSELVNDYSNLVEEHDGLAYSWSKSRLDCIDTHDVGSVYSNSSFAALRVEQ